MTRTAPWPLSVSYRILPYLLIPLIMIGFFSSLPTVDRITNTDFGGLWESGRAASQGLDPYAEYPLTLHASFGDVQETAVNRNSPLVVLALSVLSVFEPLTAFRVWYAFSLLLYLVAIGLLVLAYRRQVTVLHVAWLLGIAPLWDFLSSGGIHMLFVLPMVGAWLLLRQDRRILAGLLIGLVVALKPHFAIWVALLFFGGQFTIVLSSIVAGILVSLVPAILYGPNVYLAWLNATFQTPWVGWPANITLAAITARLGMTWLGLLLGFVLLAALAVWTWKTRPHVLQVAALGLLASLLVSPSGWPGYVLVLLPLFFELRWNFSLRLAAILLVFPVPLIWALSKLSPWHLFLIGSLYGWILLLVLAAVINHLRDEHQPDSSLISPAATVSTLVPRTAYPVTSQQASQGDVRVDIAEEVEPAH